MLDYRILNQKPLITKDNETYMDLLSKTFVFNENMKIKLIEVEEYYIGRPDLISLAVYGTDAFADIICKVNGISNPFELNEGDILIIPSIEEINNATTNGITSEFADSIVKSDDNRKKISNRRSPNELVYGDYNYIIDHSLGLVFY